MNAPPYTITNESVTVVWKGKPYTVQKDSPHFASLRKVIIEQEWDKIPDHLTIQKSLAAWAYGKFKIEGERIIYEDEDIPTDIHERIMTMHANGEDPTVLFRFWERLKKNPSFRSVKQLFGFIRHKGIPLTKDGCFLAYKAVRGDYKDKHSGTVTNKPGTVNEMPRNKISDDPDIACHDGFHVGAEGYVNGFGSVGDRIVICKVDPEHVVCVPRDHSQEKMRVCKYAVIGHKGETMPDTVIDEPLAETDDYEENEKHVDEQAATDAEAGDEDNKDYDPDADPLREDGDDDKGEDTQLPEQSVRDEVKKVDKAIASDLKTKQKPGKKEFAKYTKMGAKELIELSLDDLRKYATYGVEIVGASKIAGGKSALVALILKTRKGS